MDAAAGEDAKSTSTSRGKGGSWMASGGRRLAEVGKAALVGARMESCYCGREAGVGVTSRGRERCWFNFQLVSSSMNDDSGQPAQSVMTPFFPVAGVDLNQTRSAASAAAAATAMYLDGTRSSFFPALNLSSHFLRGSRGGCLFKIFTIFSGN